MQAEVSSAAGQAADAWAAVEALEAKGDAAAAADGAAHAVALQQQFEERQAAADAASKQAQQQVWPGRGRRHTIWKLYCLSIMPQVLQESSRASVENDNFTMLCCMCCVYGA